MKKHTVLITGGAGFIGHHMVEGILKTTDWNIVILDRLDTSGSLERLKEIDLWEQEKHRIKLVWHDLKAEINHFVANEIGDVDYIIHLAASTHVDRSIEYPLMFVMDNVVGTCNLLTFARKLPNLKKIINFSTDEVWGPAEPGKYFSEFAPHRPSNPYSASKGGQTDLGYAFYVTYGLPVINTHTVNNFGECQDPEKLIPKTIRNVLHGQPMPVFAAPNPQTGKLEAVGSRCWIHARNTLSAVQFLLEHGKAGEEYNIPGKEYPNIEICEMIAKFVGKPLLVNLVDVSTARPGHDSRYALDGSKLEALGWKAPMSVEESLEKVVKWTLAHEKWLYESVKAIYER